MDQIYPLEEDLISQYCGLPVYVVMKDGSRHIGILSRCSKGKLTLNEDPNKAAAVETEAEAEPPKSSKKNKKSGKSKSPSKSSKQPEQPVQTQSYPFDPYYYEPRPYIPFRDVIAIDLAHVAFLFLIY